MGTIETVAARRAALPGARRRRQLELSPAAARTCASSEGEHAVPRGRRRRHLLRRPPRQRRARDVRAGARAGHDRDARGRRGGRLVVALPAVPLALRRAGALARARDRLRRRLPARQVRARSAPRLRADVAASPQVLIERLQWTRLRLLDVYGNGRATDARRRRPMAPVAVPRRAPAARDARHVDARARAGRRRAGSRPRRASSRCSTPSASARCRSRSRATRDGPARPHRARRRRGDARRSAPRGRATCSACAARSATRGRSRPRPAATSSSSRAASGWRRCGRPSTTCSQRRGEYGEVVVLYGSRTPADLLYRGELERWRGRSTSRST